MAFNSLLHAVPDKVLISDDHVVAASNQYQSTIFQYDPIGNLAEEISIDHAKNRLDGKLYNYSDTAQLMEIVKLADGTAETTALDHDEFGRLTRMGDRQFQYDSFNMMMSFTSPDVNASYGYDPLTGLRSEKTVNHQTTRYVLDDSQRVIQELDQENKIISEIIYGEKGPQTYIYKGQTYTYDLDSLGSVIALKNAKGEVVNQYSYDVWGDLIKSEEQVPNAIRYRGEYQDAETGFYYLRGRYYDPATRQFTTSDPAEDGLNWNMYCEGNPVNYADPSGYVKVAMRKVRMPMKAEIFAYETYYSGDNLFDIITETESDLKAISEEIMGWIPGLNVIQTITNIIAALKDAGVSHAAVLAGQHRKGLRVIIYKENNTEIGVRKEEVEREFVERLATTPFYVGRSY